MVGKKWTKEEVNKLIEIYPNHNTFEVAQLLGRSLESVQVKADRLRLRKSKKYMREKGKEIGKRSVLFRGDKLWTVQEREKLKRIYAITPTRELARIFNCTVNAIRAQAWLLKLHKDKKALAYSVGVEAHRLGEEGERFAEEFFRSRGWEILERGRNMGAGIGCSPFDFIVRTRKQEKYAINVKHGHDMHFKDITLRNLMKLPYRSAILYVSPNKQFFFMPIFALTSEQQQDMVLESI